MSSSNTSSIKKAFNPNTFAMILLARAITQRFSNPTNNHLRTSSNTKNQAIVQGDRVTIQSRNSGNDGRNTRRSYVQEEIIKGNTVQNDDGNIQRTLQTTSSGTAVNVQCYNCSEKGHYAHNCPKSRVRDSKYFMEQMLLAKQDEAGVTLIDEQNDFFLLMLLGWKKLRNTCKYMLDGQNSTNVNSGSVEYDNNVQSSYELEQLARNTYQEAEKQQIIAKKVQQQNTVLTKHLESYKEKLAIVELKRQIEELQKTQTILKRKMSENEDKYQDIVLDLEARAKKNEDVVLKISNSLQGMFMLGPKPMSFYDSNVKHGLGYENPYTLKKVISQNPKLYDASCFDDSNVQMNVRDSKDILDDATKS
ncbi:retrovirus-related pol polyprotein from transposon TNT 1-94 [Tanacetum coccineum]